MLSRVANNLYWMSRYIERAENIARIVDVNLQLLLDLRNLDADRLQKHWLPIIETTGEKEEFFKQYSEATAKNVTEFLVFQEDNPNSLVSCICQARENARTVRDQITSSFWEELNRIYWFVRTPQARKVWEESPSDFFQQIKTASLNLIGMTYATLLHNEGWWFTQVGKFMERADKTTRILDIGHTNLPKQGLPQIVSQQEALEWVAILRSCSGWDAFKSIHGAEVRPQHVAEFLLLNPDFPRSVRFCLGELDIALRSISGVPAGRFTNEAEKRAGRMVAELQFCSISDIFERGVHAYLDGIQEQLNDIGQAVFDAYVFQPVISLEEEMFVQQQQQQQQSAIQASSGEGDVALSPRRLFPSEARNVC